MLTIQFKTLNSNITKTNKWGGICDKDLDQWNGQEVKKKRKTQAHPRGNTNLPCGLLMFGGGGGGVGGTPRNFSQGASFGFVWNFFLKVFRFVRSDEGLYFKQKFYINNSYRLRQATD